ncbi:ABC transporter ATP-binding protein [Cellulomonas hominis]|uniref:ABC transporter ATP-binding protein n=1 Tax=Cellulomonas hominis TaxID=156981 RepID=A0A511FAS8_9CELL|nr:ABC transporter ATP-binding protein [Cellulomonas hominis]MBB5474872.1 ABC-2 type transport system ATP-binding protein [Cellulomonas hominis]GEL44898.1 ABC transporter ATP-binding protein [Cellulomonas hominis]
MTGHALLLEGVTVPVGSFALRDVSLALPTGYVMGLVGPNGAGKTTTIRTLLGMLRPAAGRVEVLGRTLPAPDALRQDVGVVLDRPSLVGEWRLRDVERALRPFYDRWDPARYAALLADFELDPASRVKALSRGMTMKLQIAVALSHGARLLLLDEPTSGLDPVARDELVGILGDYLVTEDRSVLFSTHITADLERIADHLTLLHAGRVVRTGTKEDLMDAYCLVRGGPEELPADGLVPLLGARRTDVVVEALVAADDVPLLGRGVVVERPTLDQIVVHLGGRTRTAVPA